MFGLAVLVVFGVYLIISFLVVRQAISHARKNGKSAKRWGWGAAFIMYSIVFWDWIPTVATHQYYCATEAGFWVYKTPEQWKKENPGVMEALVANKGAPSTRQGDMKNFTDTYFLNQRINKVVKKAGPLLFNRWRWEQQVIDAKTGEVLARNIDFSTGNGNIGGEPPLMFWLQINGCTGNSAINGSEFHAYKSQFSRSQQ
jgi:hypothetical protein